jgi:hypothetical protein
MNERLHDEEANEGADNSESRMKEAVLAIIGSTLIDKE